MRDQSTLAPGRAESEPTVGPVTGGCALDHLSQDELAAMASSLSALARRLEGFRRRLSVLDAAVEASPRRAAGAAS